mgnify:FL=1
MTPISLKLHNFLSYGEDVPPLDFTQFDIACLSGNNGHGKSALLDAITYALWGLARKASNDRKPDTGLVRQGTSEMRVTFEFELKNQRFLIQRRYKKGSNKQELDFQLFDGINYKSLTESDSIKPTQARINQELSLDHETFINSAFIAQGRSNVFSKKTPKERKEVLSQILGLERYDRLEEKARERSSKEKYSLQKYEDELKRIKSELIGQIERENEQKETDRLINELGKKLEGLKEKLDKLILNIHENKQKIEKIEEIKNNRKKLSEDFKRKSLEIQEKLNPFNEESDDQILLREEEILKGKKTFIDIHPKIIELEEKNNEYREARYSLEEANQKISIKEVEAKLNLEKLDGQLQTFNKQISDYEGFLKREPEIRSTHKTLKQIDKINETFNSAFELRLDQEILNLERKMEEIEKTGLGLREKIKEGQIKRSKLTSEHQNKKEQIEKDRLQNEDICSWCGSAMDETHRLNHDAKLEDDYNEKLTAIEAEIKSLKKEREGKLVEFSSRKKKCDKIRQQKKNLERNREELFDVITQESSAKKEPDTFIQGLIQLKLKRDGDLKKTGYSRAWAIDYEGPDSTEKRKVLEQEHSRLDVEKEELHKALEKRDNIKKLYEEKLNAFKNKDYEIGYKENRKKLTEKIALLANVNGELRKSQKTRDNNEQYLKQSEDLKEAKDRKILREEFKKTKITFEEKNKSYSIELSNRESDVTTLGDIENEEERAKKEYNENSTKRDELNREKGRLDRLCEQDKKNLEKSKELEVKINICNKQYNLYSELQKAFGKKGIQALIIAETTPQIEIETNEILSRLTGNQIHITIDSLRTKKDGDTEETLDIKISDDLGERPYDLYSGGEAFRTDFALHIALSKVLASRSGAQLRTLFIDEGFGTQDQHGIDQIVETIQAIRDDFDKIIVVTHLPELKEVFPVQIQVEKYPEVGSTFELIIRN